MAFVSNPSPSEDRQSSSGTDLNINNTEDEMHIDTTNWTLAKRKKVTTYDRISMKSTSGYLVKRPPSVP